MLRIFERRLRPLNRIEINKRKVLENYRSYADGGKTLQFWPVLKSNAYGCGIEQIVEILDGESFEYWVADSYMEALRIWKRSDKKVLLIGPMWAENYKKLDWERITLMVQRVEELKELGRLGRRIRVQLKVNTGMNRQGFDWGEIPEAIKVLKKYPEIEVEGVLSHLMEAGDWQAVRKQEKIFGRFLDYLEGEEISPKWRHLAASEGVFKTRDKRINAVRLGIGLYRRALRLVSVIVKVRLAKKGEMVSYEGTYELKKDAWLGVVPVGYYEGLDRRLSNVGVVKYKNKYYRIAGKVCMNMVVVDFGGTRVREGEEVEVIGEKGKNSIEENAKKCQTISYEMMVKLNQTIRRVII